MNVKRDFEPRLFELLHDPAPRKISKSELRLLLWPYKRKTLYPNTTTICDHWIDLTPEFRELLDLSVEDFPGERFHLLHDGRHVNRWMDRVENHIYYKYKKNTPKKKKAVTPTPDTPTPDTPDTPTA